MVLLVLLSLAQPLAADTTTLRIGGVDVPFVYVEPGRYEREHETSGTQTVVLTRGFWLARHEVTWEVWKAVMGWDDGRGQPRHPARRMSWLEARDFVDRAGAAVEGWSFRLPTEAEWEYAARAGTTTPWSSGADSTSLGEVAWTRANSGAAIQPVGRLRPNAWGLHDMHGNVWEWVADWMGAYPPTAVVTDPAGPPSGTERVRRGGSAIYGADAARSSNRYQQPPDRGNGNLGLRIVAVPTESVLLVGRQDGSDR